MTEYSGSRASNPFCFHAYCELAFTHVHIQLPPSVPVSSPPVVAAWEIE